MYSLIYPVSIISSKVHLRDKPLGRMVMQRGEFLGERENKKKKRTEIDVKVTDSWLQGIHADKRARQKKRFETSEEL